MSNKKEMVAIDKEQWNYIVDKLTKDVPDSNKEAFLKAVNPIEIQIDQSIEERANDYSKKNYAFISSKKDYFIEGATSQQIIEQLRVKEKECSKCEPISGFYLGTTCPECGKPFRSVKS